MKCAVNWTLNFLKVLMELGVNWLNQILAAPFSVVGKALHMISSATPWRCIKVLKVSRWSRRSLTSSWLSIYDMWNLCGRGKELTKAVNRESVLLTRSSRSLDTRPLRAFIITSIRSCIACISATTSGGVSSARDGRLTFCRSSMLGELLPSGPSQSRRSALVSSRSSFGISCPVFRYSCSSKTWFCLVRRSTAPVRVCTCLSRVVSRGSSSWTLLVVAIDRVSTMQLFVKEALAVTYNTTYVSHRRRQLMMLEN